MGHPCLYSLDTVSAARGRILGWAFISVASPVAHMSRLLSGAANLDDVAEFLRTTPYYLRFILYGRRYRAHYRRFKIPKRRGGYREIAVPPDVLKNMQRKLAAALLDLHPAKPSAHGFLRDRSVVSNATRHEGQRVVGNLDLLNFFSSIHLGRVTRALQQPPYSLGAPAALVVGQLCCDEMGILPTGAPSSPILSNIISRNLDEQLQQIARKHGCRYTRYADDITISTSRPALPSELIYLDPLHGRAMVGPLLESAIASSGFTVNPDKVRIARIERKQEVTGLTTNERVNVGRRYVRELDSLIFIWRRHGVETAAASYAKRHKVPPSRATPARFLNFLRGKFSYLRMVKGENDPVCRRAAALHVQAAGRGGGEDVIVAAAGLRQTFASASRRSPPSPAHERSGALAKPPRPIANSLCAGASASVAHARASVPVVSGCVAFAICPAPIAKARRGIASGRSAIANGTRAIAFAHTEFAFARAAFANSPLPVVKSRGPLIKAPLGLASFARGR